MTRDQQINIAIAEACGWKWCIVRDEPGEHRWQLQNRRKESVETNPGSPWSVKFEVFNKPFGPEGWDGSLVPNYCNDLNAMHDAEKILNEKQQVWYLQRLTQVRFKEGIGGMIGFMTDKAVFATAHQRAEAFLRTIGKWTNE